VRWWLVDAAHLTRGPGVGGPRWRRRPGACGPATPSLCPLSAIPYSTLCHVEFSVCVLKYGSRISMPKHTCLHKFFSLSVADLNQATGLFYKKNGITGSMSIHEHVGHPITK
jgi:hypothetical protein